MKNNRIKKIFASVVASGILIFSLGPAMNTLGGVLGTAEDYINLRSTPAWKGEIIQVVSPGEEFTVLSVEGSWVKVNLNGKTGYLPEMYVSTRSVETTSTTSEPETTSEDVNESYDYTLYSSTKVYANADDASNYRNPLKTYEAGSYYIYKSYNGMINISKVSGQAGAWINPNEENNVPVVTSPVTTSPSTTKVVTTSPTTTAATAASPVVSGDIKVHTNIKVYATADSAKEGVNYLKSYPAGTYYIYKIYNGMYNISKEKNIPGAWINPSDLSGPVSTSPITTSPVTTSPKTTAATSAAEQSIKLGGVYNLYVATPVYVNADNASDKVNSIGTYGPGKYYIYKIYNGMANISKTPDIPGAWANLGNENVVTPVTKPTTTVATTTAKTTSPVTTSPKTTAATTTAKTTTATNSSSSSYKLTGDMAIYGTASDAINRVSSIGSYSAGTYYIYKTYNGMYNVTRTPGIPGAWIIPSSTGTSTTSPTTTSPKSTTTTKTTNSTSRPSNDVSLPSGYINYSNTPNGYLIQYGTNLKSSPTGGYVVAYLDYGTVVKLLETSGANSKVEYLGTGKIGWVSSAAISKIEMNQAPVYGKPGGNGYVIGIDPGHGGPDTGAVGYIDGKTVTERDMNFVIARKTRDVLENMGFKVILSQESEDNDDYIYNKMTMFNQAEVDYAISIHQNAGGSQGSLVLYSEDKNNPTADKVNIEASKELGQFISNELAKVTGKSSNIGDLTFYGDKGLRVNKSVDAPSALLELGFMDNSKDLAIIASESGQQKFANAIATGILNMIKSK